MAAENVMKLRLCRSPAVAAIASCFLGSLPTLAQNAYITNDGSGNVTLIDTATNTVIDTVPVGKAPFAVAVSPNGGTVYVANIASSSAGVEPIAELAKPSREARQPYLKRKVCR
jgi:YVTN family beta-propeller protein